jgi:uncharacterized membrane protein YqjE
MKTDAHGEAPAGAESQLPPDEPAPEVNPAREIGSHLLRMLETRIDAAQIALQGETQLLMSRLQLKLLAGAAIFFAVWGGIVLLAIALPEHLRVPVLGAVVGAFVLTAVIAQWVARRKAATHQIGSMRWFLDSLRQDFELLSRTLSRSLAARQPPERVPPERSPPSDLAA